MMQSARIVKMFPKKSMIQGDESHLHADPPRLRYHFAAFFFPSIYCNIISRVVHSYQLIFMLPYTTLQYPAYPGTWRHQICSAALHCPVG